MRRTPRNKRSLPTHRPDGLPLFSPKGIPIHWIRTSAVMKVGNPLNGCWQDIHKPISLKEIEKCLAAGREKLHEPFEWSGCEAEDWAGQRRAEHIEKIAWFVRHGFQEPLSLDVGIPSMNFFVQHKVQDGNHRLAAAIYRAKRFGEDPLLPLSVGGEVSYAIELGLWEKDPFIDAVHRAAAQG